MRILHDSRAQTKYFGYGQIK